jgi:hypothetical protein
MSQMDIYKMVGALMAAAFVALGGWLFLTGRIGPLKEAEERNARERIQRQLMEGQRQQNLRRPFEAVGIPSPF